MDPAAASTASSAFTWRRSLAGAGAGAHAAEERALLVRQRVDELEAATAWLRAEKEAAERAAAALKADLECERGAAGTAASEAMMMIARLQREKSAAMIEAREFRRILEGRATHDREVQDRLDDVCKLAAAYRERLRAHGIDPDDESEHREERERDGAGVDGDVNCGKDTEANDVVIKEPPPSPSPAAEELKYAVAVRCAAVTTKAAAEERVAGDLCARVEALEAESAAVRAQVALARRVCRDAAVVVVGAQKQRFSALAIFKWFFSTVLRGRTRSASAARVLRNPSSSAAAGSWATANYFRLCLLPLLERFKGTPHMRSKMSGNGNGGLRCRSTPLW